MQLIPKQYTLLFSILLFLIFFNIIAFIIKPGFLYNFDGSIKQFGLGYSHKTIVPFWLLTIGVAILSYLAIFYYSMVKIVY
tara:strand:- start:445 stop:687 length:243 start_codon:yes stop_codon:yes gene_type:complete